MPTGESNAVNPAESAGMSLMMPEMPTITGPRAAATPAITTSTFRIVGDIPCRSVTIRCRNAAIRLMNGVIVCPICSRKSPHEFLSCLSAPMPTLAAASACPPNFCSSASRMTVWALAVSPVSTSCFTIVFCSSVKLMPARERADILPMGSSRALPSMVAALPRSISSAVLISRTICWVRLKLSPVMLVNAKSRVVTSFRMVSSPKMVLLWSSLA